MTGFGISVFGEYAFGEQGLAATASTDTTAPVMTGEITISAITM
jgi:hypothetical protein